MNVGRVQGPKGDCGTSQGQEIIILYLCKMHTHLVEAGRQRS